jgi:hypothetical protein
MRILLQQHPRTRPLQPLHDLVDLLRRSVAQKDVNVVARDLTRDNLQLMLHSNLPNQVAHSNRDLPGQHLFPVFRDPHEMYLEVALRVRSQSVVAHSTMKVTAEGRTDGSDNPLHGPALPPDPTISFKALSPTKIRYVMKIDGNVDNMGEQTLAADGRSFSDVNWNPGKENEKTTGVFVKQWLRCWPALCAGKSHCFGALLIPNRPKRLTHPNCEAAIREHPSGCMAAPRGRRPLLRRYRNVDIHLAYRTQMDVDRSKRALWHNAASGGVVTIELRPGEAHYAASWSHYVQSESYDRFWSGSFPVIAPDAAVFSP